MDNFIIIGRDDKSQCTTCYAFFKPESEYHQQCERRATTRNFPPDLPAFAKNDPHAFCSEPCEQDARDEARLARIEFEREMSVAL